MNKFLYHGTSEKYIDQILRDGIQPRGKNRQNNWEHTISSNPDTVYLTDTYPMHFCGQASDSGRWAIIEIDTDRLDRGLFIPDEDAIAHIFHSQIQRMKRYCKSPAKESIAKILWDKEILAITLYIRNNIEMFYGQHEDSLTVMGTCGYRGTVPVKAITRMAFYDPLSNPMMTMVATDSTICPMNYRFCKNKYQNVIQWMFGKKFTAEDWSEHSQIIFNTEEQNKYLQEMLNNQQLEIREINP